MRGCSGMMVESLEYFVAIARGATFLDVAEDYSLSQSALSKIIKRLEEELGVKLFDRSGRTVKLTQGGEQLLNDLNELEPHFKTMMLHMRQLSSKRKLNVLVGLPSGVINLRNILHSFSTDHPEIPLTVVELRKDRRQAALAALRGQEMDFVIMHRSMRPSGYKELPLMEDDHLVAILPPSHPLCAKEAVTLEDLKEEKLLLNFWTAEVIQEATDYTQVLFTHISEKQRNREDILWKVITGQGVSVFYTSDIRNIKMERVALRPIADLPSQPVVLIGNPNIAMTPEHLTLQKYLIKALQEL